ncbi:MAG TPA: WXG100 family type VII secretion target [Jatrophihabitantaceae bacterium]
MTGAFTTEQEAMQRGANAVQEAHQQVQGLIQTLNGEIEQMLGGWGGQAANAFLGVHEAFNSQATKINAALDRMHGALVSTHTTYGTQESDQSQTFTNMTGNING